MENKKVTCKSCRKKFLLGKGGTCLHYISDKQFICNECLDVNHENAYGISCYHGNNGRWKEYRTQNDNENTTLYGFELETNYCMGLGDLRKDTNFVKGKFPIAVCSNDSSIGLGYEIVSQPFSYNYIMDHKDGIKQMFDYLIANGYTSHDNNHCGLHFHITRPSGEVIDRIIFIMETYKKEFIKCSRRTTGQLNSWASFLSDKISNIGIERIKGLDFIKDYKGNYVDHCSALNLSSSKTIEIRIFRGTLNFESFMASYEIVHNLIELCSDLTIPVKKITWKKLTNGKYIKKYVEEHNINTNIIPNDMTKELLKEFKKSTILKSKMYNIINKKIKELYKNIDIKIKNYNDLQKTYNEISNIYNKVNSLYNTMQNISHYDTRQNIKNYINGLYLGSNASLYKELIELVNEGGEK